MSTANIPRGRPAGLPGQPPHPVRAPQRGNNNHHDDNNNNDNNDNNNDNMIISIMYACVYVYILYIYIYIHTYVYVSNYIYTYIHIYIYIYMCVCIYIYTHIRIKRDIVLYYVRAPQRGTRCCSSVMCYLLTSYTMTYYIYI